MAFIRCESGGGGSVVAVTTLWTNPSPANDFASQDVTLNDSVQNFDLIEIRYKSTKTAGNVNGVVYHVEDLLKFGATTVTSDPEKTYYGGICARASSSYWCCRAITYVDDTTLNFHGVVRSGGAETVNNIIIPLSIVGIKYSN